MSTQLFDVLPDTGIFTAINNIKPFPWADIITPAQMDISYKQLYTGKPISKMVMRYLGENTELTEDNIKALANILYNMFYEKWSLAYTLYNAQNKAFQAGYSETEKRVTTKDYKTTDTGTISSDKTDTNKVSAFDTANFENKEQNTNSGTDTRDLSGTETGTQDRTTEKEGFSISYMDYYKKSFEALQNYLLYDIIFVDANSILTLHIYD